jgi:hypothetical protein
MKTLTPPKKDQIEVIVFGPGYGECIVVHLGENRWIIVDSCINTQTGKPAVLDYFDTIGISPKENVKLIIISHWHDDHIRGLSDIILSCPEASVCCSSALTQREFISHVLDYHDMMMATSSGVDEIKQTLEILKKRDIIYAFADRPILNLPAEESAAPCIVTTLSPSDVEYKNFLKGIASLIPPNMKTKIRAPSLTPNNAAVAVWIEAGDVRILLGSDLAEKGDSSSGWSAIVQSKKRPQGRASLFKIPHHGSVTGHHDNVWSDMLIKLPIVVLSPFYNAGRKIPTSNDVKRILDLAPNSYITARDPASKSKINRPPSVERAIRDIVGKIRVAQPTMGWVRLQNGGKSSPDKWNVQLSSAGSHLNGFYTKKNKT